MPLKTMSMRTRAVLVSALVVFIFFSVAGIALHRAFANSVEQSAENELQAFMVSLLSTMEFDSNDSISNKPTRSNRESPEARVIFETLPLPELAQANSGVYAEIWDKENLLWRSESLIGRELPRVEANLGEYRLFPPSIESSKYILSLLVDWQDLDVSRQFSMVVAVDAEPYQAQLRGYDRTVISWLLGLGGFLIVFLWLLFAWLFRPLSRVIHQLKAIELGEKRAFDDDFPAEVSALTGSLNDYIDHEKQQIQKQKDSLANLAHSLKTPLAVIRASVDKRNSVSSEQNGIIEQQLDNMSDSIEYQLNKASILARRRYMAPVLSAEPLDRVVTALQTLHRERNINVIKEIDEHAFFVGEEGDLLEVAGNLLENAFKWCQNTVILRVANGTNESDSRKLRIEVIDDGPGIAADRRNEILLRGKRLDERVQGHGIGLSIVADIIDAYEGEMELGEAVGVYQDGKGEIRLEQGLRVVAVL